MGPFYLTPRNAALPIRLGELRVLSVAGASEAAGGRGASARLDPQGHRTHARLAGRRAGLRLLARLLQRHVAVRVDDHLGVEQVGVRGDVGELFDGERGV